MGFTDIFKIKEFKAEINRLKQENQQLTGFNDVQQNQLKELGAYDYYEIQAVTF